VQLAISFITTNYAVLPTDNAGH